MPPKGPQTRAIRHKNRWKPRQMSHIVRLCVSGMAPQNLVGPRKSARSVCYNPRKWREMTVFGKACAPASPGPKYRPEWCPTSRNLHAHPGHMNFVAIVEFSGPENWLVTGAARHEMPQKDPQTCTIRPKNWWKPRQVSPTSRLCVSRMTPQNLVGPRKLAQSVAHENGAKRPF